MMPFSCVVGILSMPVVLILGIIIPDPVFEDFWKSKRAKWDTRADFGKGQVTELETALHNWSVSMMPISVTAMTAVAASGDLEVPLFLPISESPSFNILWWIVVPLFVWCLSNLCLVKAKTAKVVYELVESTSSHEADISVSVERDLSGQNPLLRLSIGCGISIVLAILIGVVGLETFGLSAEIKVIAAISFGAISAMAASWCFTLHPHTVIPANTVLGCDLNKTFRLKMVQALTGYKTKPQAQLPSN